MAAVCEHLDHVLVTDVPASVEGCVDCLREGTRWVHLRMCHECGEVRCCDNSPEQHATKHFQASAHPVMRSVEPGEAWSWCFIDEVAFRIATE